MARRDKHPIQKVRRPMPPPTKVKPNKRKEAERKPWRPGEISPDDLPPTKE